MAGSSDLKAPALLVAMPQVLDPFFHRSVVLLAHHDENGSLGFIVNRGTAIRVGEILLGMEISWGGDSEAVAFFGGPVHPQLGTVLYDPPKAGEAESEAFALVAPKLALTQHVGELARLAQGPPGNFRLYLGYAGWGSGQLVNEILRNDWIITPPEPELIFDPDPEGAWAHALATVGVDPASLPTWTASGEEDEAN